MTITYRGRGNVFYVVVYAGVSIRTLMLAVETRSALFRAAAIGFLFLVTFAVYVLVRGRVELTPDALVLVDVRRTELPWTQITSVRALDRSAGVRQVVVTARGRTYWLRAPQHTPLAPDRDFDAKVATIKEWWERARPPVVT